MTARRRSGQWSPGAAGPVLRAVVTDWRERAACRDADPGLFFPVEGQDGAAARALCDACPVRARCLRFALDAGIPDGIFGGLDDAERARLAAGRPAPAPAVPAAPRQPQHAYSVSVPDLTAAELARYQAKTAPGGCGTVWTGGTRRTGHGVFSVRRDGVQQKLLAHRIAFRLATGTDPGALAVVQACWNPACLTGACLSAETPGDARRRAAQQGKTAA